MRKEIFLLIASILSAQIPLISAERHEKIAETHKVQFEGAAVRKSQMKAPPVKMPAGQAHKIAELPAKEISATPTPQKMDAAKFNADDPPNMKRLMTNAMGYGVYGAALGAFAGGAPGALVGGAAGIILSPVLSNYLADLHKGFKQVL